MKKIEQLSEDLRFCPPRSRGHLRDYIRYFFGVEVPDYVVTEGHSSAMDYIWDTYNADFLKKPRVSADAIVWANRGGGKTQSAAIATVLDAIFKPGIQVRILSGTGEQAGRLYEYFEKYVNSGYEHTVKDVKSWPRKKTIFKNGAMVEVLIQAETSVRGQHVHKLRCDEVELFKDRVYEAAQYSTMSSDGYIAAFEVISTMHLPYGIMRRLIKDAGVKGQKIYKWNLWDVIERCRRECKPECPLYKICCGKAKKGKGYFGLNDAITQLGRTKERSFFYEMLCGEDEKRTLGRVGCRRY
jgi:hypothetical protein